MQSQFKELVEYSQISVKWTNWVTQKKNWCKWRTVLSLASVIIFQICACVFPQIRWTTSIHLLRYIEWGQFSFHHRAAATWKHESLFSIVFELKSSFSFTVVVSANWHTPCLCPSKFSTFTEHGVIYSNRCLIASKCFWILWFYDSSLMQLMSFQLNDEI